MTSKATNAVGLSAREVDILCAMCQSMKSKPDTDMKKFAALTGFTPSSAQSTLGMLLKRIKDTDLAAPETGKKKGSGRKRKADKEAQAQAPNGATENEGEGEDGGDNTVVKDEVQDECTDELD